MSTTLEIVLLIDALAGFVISGVIVYRMGVRRGRACGVQEGRDLQRVEDIQEQWRKESARHGKDGKFVAIKGKVNA